VINLRAAADQVRFEVGAPARDERGPATHRDLLTSQGLDDRDPRTGQGDDDDVKDGDRRGWAGGRIPPRRVEAASTIMSCTAPARQTPTTSQTSPGR
jgi:hypothetical protein